MPRLAAALAFFAVVNTNACRSPMKAPDIQLNPHPKLRYELTLTILDAPGPFESLEGVMQYEVIDKRCSPEDSFSGTRNPPFKDVPIEFSRRGDNTYSGTLYLDFLMDEDYYALGVCHWKMVGVTTQLKSHGVTFSSYISSKNFFLQQPVMGYFGKSTYAQATVKNRAFAGVPFSDWISKQPENFFSTTLSTKVQFE
jgi:hypothetical protein